MLKVLGLMAAVLFVIVALAGWALDAETSATRDWAVARVAERLEPRGAPDGPPKTFVINPGESLQEVTARLGRDGVVRNPLLLRLLLRYYGIDRGVRAGRYTLPSDTSVGGLVGALAEGQIELVRVTVVEGWRAEEIGDALERSGVGSRAEFLGLVHTPRRPPLTDRTAASLEGFLFPDTYLVPPEYGAAAFLELMLKTFEARARPEIPQAGARGPQLSFYEQVVLASIVEREAKVAEERPVIAATFMNRLWEEMHLAADPTVQYALATARPPYWRDELGVDDLKVASPYNTYVVRGLPPTPIANPGLAALKAVLQPEAAPYRYFVAKPDGSHAFAVTFEEHLNNLFRYQRGG